MINYKLSLLCTGVVCDDEDYLKTNKCTFQLELEQPISEETALFIRTHILECVLSDFYGFNVHEVIQQHLEIENAIKHK